jgi:4-coumarate--CoA ligase
MRVIRVVLNYIVPRLEVLKLTLCPGLSLGKDHSVSSFVSERVDASMPQRSRWSIDIPITSLPSLILAGSRTASTDAQAFVDAEEPEKLRLSWKEYALWSKRIARGLLDAGLKPGDRVLVYSGNNIFFPVVFMGVIMAGGIITTANPAFVARELAYQMKDCQPRFVLIAQGSKDHATEAASLAGLCQSRIHIFDDGPLRDNNCDVGSLRHWSRLIASAEKGESYQWAECRTMEDARQTVAILYSSGTTGVPKGVEITHYGLVANAVQLNQLYNLNVRQEKDQRLLAFLPCYHGLGLLQLSTMAPYRRVTSFVMKKFSLLPTLENVQRFRITELSLVPPILIAIAKNPEARNGKFDLSSVRKVQVGAAPLSREMCEEFEKLWPDGSVNVKQGWGMTEYCPFCLDLWTQADRYCQQTACFCSQLG